MDCGILEQGARDVQPAALDLTRVASRLRQLNL
jgi:hypothetical protein